MCCGPEKIVKKKIEPPIFEKKPYLSKQQTSEIFPKSLGEAQGIKSSQIELKQKKSSLLKQRPQEVLKSDQFSTIREEKQKSKGSIVLKKLQKCGYNLNELDQLYKGTNNKWTDPDFLHQDIRYGDTFIAKWKRASSFIEKPDLFPQQVSPNDVIQGLLNDCYFLSAVSGLAQRPYRIHQIFTTKEYNPNGYYICKLNFNGIYQEVIVDDYFPMDPKPNQAIYARPSQGRYIWVMLLEKCWAKLLKGYKNCDFGYTSEAFQTLTGAPTKAYILREYQEKDPNLQEMFKKLKDSDQKHHCIQVSRNRSNSKEEREQMQKEGLPMGHAYTLLGVYETTLKTGEIVRLLQIRNPWGTQESKLGWNDNDPIWDMVDASEKERMQFRYNKHSDDGVFYMQWSDFAKKFDHLFSICEIDDNAHYTFVEFIAQDRQPIFLEVTTDGNPEQIGIYFVQEMQQHFKEEYQYCGISVAFSNQTIDQNGQKYYQLIGTYNYFNSVLDNFFTVPIRKAPKGQYLLRLYVYWPEVCQKKTKVVGGLYSSATVGIKNVTGQINNEEFIQKNCISRARKSFAKMYAPNDHYSWMCMEILQDTNIGFMVFHHGALSPIHQYNIHFDQTHNHPLYFLNEFRGRTVFDIETEKGFEEVVVYAYVPKYDTAMDKCLYPTFDPEFKLPTPKITGR